MGMITTYEGNDPLVHFYFFDKTGKGQTTVVKDVLLTGVTINMYIKESPDVADGTAKGSWTVVDAAGGLADVQLTAAECGGLGRKWYRVDIVKGGHAQTADAGWLIVKNG